MNPWPQASDESESTKNSQRLKIPPKSNSLIILSSFETSMYVCTEEIFKSETKPSFYKLKTKT